MEAPDHPHELLLYEMSRRNTDFVAGLIVQKPELFDVLFDIFLSNVEPVSRRAAWVIDTVSEKMPWLLHPRIPEIIRLLPEFKHDGLKRHSVRMMARSPLPEGDLLGILINICFDWLVSPAEAAATKVFCMEILYRISEMEPDLKKELADSIEWRLNEETPGVRNRGTKMLKKLYEEINGAVRP
ncbi:MAG: hypothetical protein WCO44_10960 [Bacteroidota bacterium]